LEKKGKFGCCQFSTPVLGFVTDLENDFIDDTSGCSIQASKEGLVMELFTADFKPLGNPPSFDTITRYTFDEQSQKLLPSEACDIARQVAGAMADIHDAGLSHGDLYAHNILVSLERKSLDYEAQVETSPKVTV